MPYTDKNRSLQLLIELKSPPVAELEAINRVFGKFPEIRDNKKVTIVFTGILPPDSVMAAKPSFMHFDGTPYHIYSARAEKKIWMYSDDFRNYTQWDGVGIIPDSDFKRLQAVVKKYHKKHKKVRFWDTPDNQVTWKLMEDLGVDYINTDHIQQLTSYLFTPVSVK
jgi:alkaline phosphatase